MVSVEVFKDSTQRAKSMDNIENQFERICALCEYLYQQGADINHLNRYREFARRAKRKYIRAIMRFGIIFASRDVYMNAKHYRNRNTIAEKVSSIERLFNDAIAETTDIDKLEAIRQRIEKFLMATDRYLTNMDCATSDNEVFHRDIYTR